MVGQFQVSVLAVRKTGHVGSLVADSLVGGSFVAVSLVADSLVGGSFVAVLLVAASLVADSLNISEMDLLVDDPVEINGIDQFH